MLREVTSGPLSTRARAALLGVTIIASAGLSMVPATAGVPPTFATFVAPGTAAADAGEPSIGVDWSTGAVMFQSNLTTYRVTNFNDAVNPPTSTWTNKSPLTSQLDFDPILFTDHTTTRTIVSLLTLQCSLSSFTDGSQGPTGLNDGDTWLPAHGCATGDATLEDHQTIGGGPYHTPLPPNPAYAHAVYYCHQDGGAVVALGGFYADCALSLNGGLDYLPPVLTYTQNQCGGLHGHIRVGPDGTAYLPNQGCAQTPGADPTVAPAAYDHQAVVRSTDNGVTWTRQLIPDSRATIYSDPSVDTGADGTVYFGYEDGGATPDAAGGHPKIAISHNQGGTWSPSVDVGTAFGIQNTAFPEVIAGDADRAAFAFLGSTTPGNDQLATFTGIWHMYVSMTYDGGATWTTVDTTPNDPVQRGCIWILGGSNPCRNLLDFNDIQVDKQGRVLVAYADGCTGACVTSTDPANNTNTRKGTIARQSSGLGLFAAFDPPVVPETPWAPAILVAGAAAFVVSRLRAWKLLPRR